MTTLSRSAAVLVTLALLGAGCAKSPAAAPQTGAEAGASAGAEVAADARTNGAADVCGNPYYPFTDGLAITYGMTASRGGAAPDYTMTVTDVTGTTATIRATVGADISAEMQADCASGTIAMRGTVDLGSMMEGSKIKTEVVSSSGTFMPATVAAGTTWQSEQTIKTEATEGPGAGMGPVTTHVAAESRAEGEESVTVPAGTYQAMKVTQTRTVTVEFAGLPAGVTLPPGMTMPTPAPTVTTTTEWWVKGIGLVKSVTAAAGVTNTVEAKSVSGN